MKLASDVKSFYADRYGSLEGFKRALATDPVGVLSDISAPLSGGVGAATRAVGATGKVARVANAAARLADPVQAATAIPKRLGRGVISRMTGTGPDALRIAGETGYRDPSGRSIQSQRLRENMRGKVPHSEIVDEARAAIRDLKDAKQAQYQRGIRSTNYQPVNMRPIGARWQTLLDSTRERGHYKIDQAGQQALQKIHRVLNEWWNDPAVHDAIGLDALKQRIQAMMPASPTGDENRIITTMANAVKDEIVKADPNYAKTMKDYERASAHEKDIERSLGLGRNQSIDTALRALTSTMRNNVNTNFGRRKANIETLAEKRPGLLEAAAGQTLNSPEARGLAGNFGPIGSAVSAAMPFFTSPRFTGEVAYYLGKASPIKRRMQYYMQQAGRLNDEDRRKQAIIRELLREQPPKIPKTGPNINLPIVEDWPIQEQ
jgi:hypothetical protein